MPIDLAKLTGNEDIVDALGLVCDLYFVTDENDRNEPLWCTVDGANRFVSLARDGSGGRFVAVPPSPRVIHASSEGQAGVVGQTVDEFIILSVTCPYWRDLLKFSGGGRLEEMRRAQPALERYWLDDVEDSGPTRTFLMSAIGITRPDDIVGLLYRNITTPVSIVHAEDGYRLEPLSGKFTVDINPMIKQYLD